MVWLNLLLLLVSCLILMRSATFLVHSVTKIGQYFKIGEFAISFILMSFATSLPELIVSVTSAIKDTGELAVGTMIGSNIASLTLITGIATVVAGKIRVKSIIKKKDIVYMTGICLILVFLLMDGTLSRPDSFILLMIYFYYMYRLLIQEKKFESLEFQITKKEFFKNIGNFIASIVFLIISAEYLVSSAKFLANEFSIPVILIGFVVVALGTSLPELSFEVTAARENHQDMVLGDVIGSVVTNSALIVGIVGLIRPMYDLELGFINTGLFFLIFVSLVLLYFIKNDGKLTVKEGIALILSYVVFISIQYLVKMVEM